MSQSETEAAVVEVSKLRPMLQTFNEELGRYINDQERYRLGRVLTIIDASFSDVEQRKAVKDLVQNMWWAADRPSEGPMSSPHTNLRGLTKALDFELYPSGDSDSVVPLNSYGRDFFESHAIKHYIQVAEEARTN